MRFYGTRETFDDRVSKGPGCWLWQGALNELGYGRATWKGRTELAHRVAWMRATGQPIPPGMCVLHVCDTPSCVRADEPSMHLVGGALFLRLGHLWLGAQADNSTDKAEKGRVVVYSGAEHWTRRRPGLVARGAGAGNAKLTEQDALDILARVAGGEGQRTVAASYGVNHRTVSALVTGVNWKHLH